MKTIIMLSTIQAAASLAKQNKISVAILRELYDLYQSGEKKEIKGITYSVLS